MNNIYFLIAKVREKDWRSGWSFIVACFHLRLSLGTSRFSLRRGLEVLEVLEVLVGPPLANLDQVLLAGSLVADVGVLRAQLHRVQHLLHPLQLESVGL